MTDPDWAGPMTGPMRGEPLLCCPKHGGWWTLSHPCPACALERRVAALEQALEQAKGKAGE